MALSVIQYPATCSLAQSPIAFAVSESAQVINSASFQYNADLFYWTGGPNASGSSKYTLVKYPNSEDVGIFDFSRILNSTLIDSRQENSSNVVYYTADFYNTYASSSISTGTTTIVSGPRTRVGTYKALDGYALFQEPINQQIVSKSEYWPIMTDGPVSQSYLASNKGTLGVFTGTAGDVAVPRQIWYTSGNGTTVLNVSSSLSSSQQIQQVPMFPSEAGFPLSGSNLDDWYTIQAVSESVVGGLETITVLSDTLYFQEICERKYPNVRIKWKNRFGQFDYFNFNMVSRNSFSTTNRSYQPQLGTFEGRTLGYNNYDSSNLNYVVDSNQSLEVNTDWVNDDFNDILKQLLVSDEIYWIYDEANNDLRPITIATNSVTFKTGVVDKKIQYALTFNYGQGYKLIL
jgi:hypothetical protein